ncbi:MAG: hypothetical protein NT124_05275, partial [Candidatus Dependentiae bacterium]|nr:hypothetical protein [Candidatus Dependentiae bacterium]
KNISKNVLATTLLISALSTCHLSWGYDVALRNDVPGDVAEKVVVTVHNASAFCKNIKKELAPEGTYKEGNGACNVTKVTAELRNVSLIPMLDNQTQQSGGFNNFQQETGGFNNFEQQPYLNSLQNQTRTNNQNQQSASGNRQGQVKNIVMAIEYKGPRTGTSTDTYVVKEKQDSNGNPIPLFNKNNKGELVNLNGMVIREQTNSPITEKDGLFFIGDKDITSQISAAIKQQMVATRTFEVIRE